MESYCRPTGCFITVSVHMVVCWLEVILTYEYVSCVAKNPEKFLMCTLVQVVENRYNPLVSVSCTSNNHSLVRKH